MSSFGSSVRATPSTTTMVFCSSSSSGRVRMSNRPVTSNSSVSSFAIEMSSAVAVVDRLADGADGLGEALDRMVRAAHSPPRNAPRADAAVVARDEAEQDFGEKPALLRPEPAHDAEVDRDQAPLRHRRTDCPDACRRGRSRRAARGAGSSGSPCGRARAGRARGVERGAVVEAACRRSTPASARRARCGPSRPRARGSPVVLAVFSAISESAAASRRKSISIATERASVSTTSTSRSRRASGRQLLGVARREAERRRGRAAKRRSTPGRSTLTATAAALRRRDFGAMHLRDRGGGDRRAEGDEQTRRAACSKAPHDRGLGDGLRERRHLVLQALEIVGERRADDIGPRRQELAELDVGRPEPLAPPTARPPSRRAAQPCHAIGRAGRGSRDRQRRHAFAGSRHVQAAIDAARTRPRGASTIAGATPRRQSRHARHADRLTAASRNA